LISNDERILCCFHFESGREETYSNETGKATRSARKIRPSLM
jgi:hypothetical protein